MTEPRNEVPSDDRDEVDRAEQEVIARLRSSGIDASDAESPQELVQLLDAVEAFERSVQRRGGDLMVDEPPVEERGEPDDALYLLPRRTADESVAAYIRRVNAATSQIRSRRPVR